MKHLLLNYSSYLRNNNYDHEVNLFIIRRVEKVLLKKCVCHSYTTIQRLQLHIVYQLLALISTLTGFLNMPREASFMMYSTTL